MALDAGLVAALLEEPVEQVGVQPHGHNFFWHRHHDLGALPEFCVTSMHVGVGRSFLLPAPIKVESSGQECPLHKCCTPSWHGVW